VVHVHLATDDFEFLGEFGVGEGGVLHDIGEDIDGHASAGGRDVDPINGAIERGVGVEIATGFLNFLVDATRATAGGAFEEHVFEDMREAGAEPAAFMDAAGPAPCLGGNDRGAVILADDDVQSVTEGDQGDIRGGAGKSVGRIGWGGTISFHDGREGQLAAVVGSGSAGWRGRRRGLCFWEEGMAEGEVEVITGLEILAAVPVGFSEHALAVIDEVEDDFAEVRAGTDAHFLEGKERHGSEGIEGVEADAFEELLAGHVAVGGIAGGAGGFMEGLLSVIEGFTDEEVSFAGVAAVESNDYVDDILKIDRMHQSGYWAALAIGPAAGRTDKT
jgi:hypothetical protein